MVDSDEECQPCKLNVGVGMALRLCYDAPGVPQERCDALLQQVENGSLGKLAAVDRVGELLQGTPAAADIPELKRLMTS